MLFAPRHLLTPALARVAKGRRKEGEWYISTSTHNGGQVHYGKCFCGPESKEWGENPKAGHTCNEACTEGGSMKGA